MCGGGGGEDGRGWREKKEEWGGWEGRKMGVGMRRGEKDNGSGNEEGRGGKWESE